MWPFRRNIVPELDQQTQYKVIRAARMAALFRIRYKRALPEVADRDLAGLVTGMVAQMIIHEEAENKRLGAVRLRLGNPVERDRTGGIMAQVHSGKELVFPISGVDIDGAQADVSGATASSSDESQVTARVDPGPELVVTDVAGGNLGSATITISVGGASAQEIVEVIAGDATAINLGAPVERDRPPTP